MDELLSRFPNIAEDVFENLRRLYSIPDKTMDFKKVKNAAKVAKKKKKVKKISRFECTSCDKGFLTQKGFSRHVEKRHPQLKWKCNYCAQGNLLEVIDNKTVRR